MQSALLLRTKLPLNRYTKLEIIIQTTSKAKNELKEAAPKNSKPNKKRKGTFVIKKRTRRMTVNNHDDDQNLEIQEKGLDNDMKEMLKEMFKEILKDHEDNMMESFKTMLKEELKKELKKELKPIKDDIEMLKKRTQHLAGFDNMEEAYPPGKNTKELKTK